MINSLYYFIFEETIIPLAIYLMNKHILFSKICNIIVWVSSGAIGVW